MIFDRMMTDERIWWTDPYDPHKEDPNKILILLGNAYAILYVSRVT